MRRGDEGWKGGGKEGRGRGGGVGGRRGGEGVIVLSLFLLRVGRESTGLGGGITILSLFGCDTECEGRGGRKMREVTTYFVPGRDTECEACQKFFRDGLTTSFNRILMDEAVLSWKPDIQVSFLSC